MKKQNAIRQEYKQAMESKPHLVDKRTHNALRENEVGVVARRERDFDLRREAE